MYSGVAGMGEYFAPVAGLGDAGAWGWGTRGQSAQANPWATLANLSSAKQRELYLYMKARDAARRAAGTHGLGEYFAAQGLGEFTMPTAQTWAPMGIGAAVGFGLGWMIFRK